ncbi:hypothetical protein [Mesorhizobium australicum]|uniref:Uncharacterized protein n=1 Tax=Mesorhizobium australicum TaxID=536018 RepID=A0A1X7NYF3_9HYPH|nr:hypothetical protein [Mesorhizobium australicum]SMH43471.1 hypothetical protein SAMN02982922_2910 [Mesorhizobium australicum]
MNMNLEDDGSLGPDYDDVMRLLHERVESSPETEELRERLALVEEAPRVLGDARLGAQTAAASAREDVERSTVHEANIRRALTDNRLTTEQREALQAQLSDARARKERDQKRAAAADAADTKALSAVGDARVVRKAVFTDLRRRLTANPGDGLGQLQFVLDPVASGAAGLLTHITTRPVPRGKRMLERVRFAEPKKEFADPDQVEQDCRVELNRLRSEREGVAAEHAPVEELKAKALLRARTLGRTSGIRVVVGKDGNVTLAFPQRPLGLTAPSGAKLGTTDAEGLICALLPDLVEAAIDRSLAEQFDVDGGMTAGEKRTRLQEIDAQLLAVERIEAAAGWQKAHDTGEPVRFRPDLNPRAILGLA